MPIVSVWADSKSWKLSIFRALTNLGISIISSNISNITSGDADTVKYFSVYYAVNIKDL